MTSNKRDMYGLSLKFCGNPEKAGCLAYRQYSKEPRSQGRRPIQCQGSTEKKLLVSRRKAAHNCGVALGRKGVPAHIYGVDPLLPSKLTKVVRVCADEAIAVAAQNIPRLRNWKTNWRPRRRCIGFPPKKSSLRLRPLTAAINQRFSAGCPTHRGLCKWGEIKCDNTRREGIL